MAISECLKDKCIATIRHNIVAICIYWNNQLRPYTHIASYRQIIQVLAI